MTRGTGLAIPARMRVSFKKLVLVWAVALILCPPVQAAPWGLKEVTNLIESRNKQGKPIATVDEFLSLMPASEKDKFTFIYQSRARFQAADAKAPRALVYNGRMAFTFNAGKGQRGGNLVELLDFDPSAARFEFREIEFGGPGHAPKYADSTPTKCLGCHGADPRPIWNQYPHWPGVYGTDDDSEDPSLSNTYVQFLNEIKNDKSSRYAKLTFPKGSPVSPYQPPDHPVQFKFRPNLAVTKIFTRQNVLRMMRILKQSPYYTSYKNSILFTYVHMSVAGCNMEPRAGAVIKEWDVRLNELLSRAGLAPFTGASQAEKMLALAGIRLPSYSLATVEPSFFYNEGELGTEELLLGALYSDQAPGDPELKKVLKPRKHYFKGLYRENEFYKFIDDLLVPLDPPDLNACRALAEKAGNELRKPALVFPSRTDSVANPFVAELRSAEEKRADPAIPVSCVYCHTVTDTGPRIPFNNSEALKLILKKANGRLAGEILARARPGAPAAIQMPPSFQAEFFALSPEDYQRFSAYIEALER